MDKEKLGYLAEFIGIRNVADQSVARLIGRPAHAGHIAEHVAAGIFDIDLHENATVKGTDGYFRSGYFQGQSVNIKYKARNDGMLDLGASIHLSDHADVYLVMTGPKSGAVSSRNTVAPWVISAVYVFQSSRLIPDLVSRGRVPGIATSVLKRLWDDARIYPDENSDAYALSPEQRTLLKLFSPIPTLPE